jgi:hypothetical protein
MKNAPKVILLLAITFGISVPKDSIAQNTDRIPQITARMPQIRRVGIGDFSAIKGTRIPTHKGMIDVIVSGRRTTAFYWRTGPTSCNTLFLQELGLPIPDSGSWHKMPAGTSKIMPKHGYAWTETNLDLQVSDIRKSSFPVEVRMGEQPGKPHPVFQLGPDFFLPGKVIDDWTHSQLIYTK